MDLARWASSIVLLVFAGGCHAELVRGGTEAQRDLIRATLDEVESASGHTFRLDSVRIREVARGAGKYNTVTRQISLDPELSDDELVEALRHELCHALDFQLDFGSATQPAWQLGYDELGSGSRRRWAREAFATTCAIAPVHQGSMLACGATALDDELQRMHGELFSQVPRVPERVPRWTGQLELPAGERLDSARITDRGHLWIGAGLRYRTDLQGNPVPAEPGEQALEAGPVGRYLFGPWVSTHGTQVVQGLEVGLATRRLLDGSRWSQLFVLRDGAYEATACADESDRWFVWDGAIWLVRQEGTRVSWGPLIDGD